MHIGVPAKTRANEARVAATPETVKKLVSQGHRVTAQCGAGLPASYIDNGYATAGAKLVDAKTAFVNDIVLKVHAPNECELGLLKSGSVLAGMLDPFNTENCARWPLPVSPRLHWNAAPRTKPAAKPRRPVVAGEHHGLQSGAGRVQYVSALYADADDTHWYRQSRARADSRRRRRGFAGDCDRQAFRGRRRSVGCSACSQGTD